jgi:uncharacterized membrane protein
VNVPQLLATLVVVIALPLNWIVTAMLWRLSFANPGYKVLRERAIVSLGLSLIVTVFAGIFVNNDFVVPPLDAEATKLITRVAILAFSTVPALYWLRLYWRGTD